MPVIEYRWEVTAQAKYNATPFQPTVYYYEHEPTEGDLVELSKQLALKTSNRTHEFKVDKVTRVSLYKEEVSE